eukprot:GSA120T00007294001.1
MNLRTTTERALRQSRALQVFYLRSDRSKLIRFACKEEKSDVCEGPAMKWWRRTRRIFVILIENYYVLGDAPAKKRDDEKEERRSKIKWCPALRNLLPVTKKQHRALPNHERSGVFAFFSFGIIKQQLLQELGLGY